MDFSVSFDVVFETVLGAETFGALLLVTHVGLLPCNQNFVGKS
jgi:hypothetical protein